MMRSVKGRQGLQGRRFCVSLFTRFLTVVLLMTLMGCESLTAMLPFGKSQNAEDPALSEDPAVAGKMSSSLLPPQWSWSDPEQRWHFVMESAQAPKVAMDGWIFDPGAIQLRVIAAPQLNQYHARSHSLILRVVQLADKKPFDDRRTTSFGLQEMLTVNAFDPAAVLSVNEYSLLPGADQMIALDRQQNVRYIGIVAGFYGLEGRRVTRIVPIPAMDDTPASSAWLNRLSFGFLGASSEAVPPRPAKLKMLLHLGLDQIDELKVSAE